MAALPPYIPSQDAKLMNWLSNFAALITASPAAYGLTSADAVNIANAVAAYQAAYTPVTSPTTKTAAAVSAKNTQRVIVLATVRPYAQQIALNAGVSSDAKIALGVNPRTSTPSAVTAPASNPVLVVQSASNLSLVVRYRDSAAGPSVKAKPYGVTVCQLSYAVSATPVTDPTALTSTLLATKSPLVLTFDASAAGKQVYLAARWATRKGLYSPWSPIVNFTVPVGA
jgi:hypothetical protein